jgi:argininosuccinate lyase
VQSSSIMPQKRNPVAFEHARAIGSKAVGQAMAVVMAVHNTPFGDIVDTEDDLQPLVFSTFRDAVRTVTLVAAALRTVEFDAEKLEARAAGGWATLTELADTLAREHGMPFRTAHGIAARLIEGHRERPGAPLTLLLSEASADLFGKALIYSDGELADILSPRHFVQVRKTLGGPAPEETARAAAVSHAELETDQSWWIGRTSALAEAERRLAARCAEL